jgi:DNA-binding HxlR family transcriptional regulator
MLSERLRSLEAEGLVERAVIPETPVRVEYELTAKGRELQSALREVASWAERWIALDEEPEEGSGKKEAGRRKRQRARTTEHAAP